MAEAAGAAVQHTRYNLRRTAARSRRWGELSVPGEQTTTALEQTQSRVSQRTRSRVSRPPRRQDRNGISEDGINREILPLQRSNEEQNSQRRPDRDTVVTQPRVRGTSASSIIDGEVGNTHSQVTGAAISLIDDVVSNTTQLLQNRRRHIMNSHNGIENAPHVSEANDTHSRGSEASAPAAQGGDPGGRDRNEGEISVAVQHGEVAGDQQPHHRYGWSWTLANSNDQDSDSGWTTLYQYRNLLIVASLTQNQRRREVQDLPEAAVNEEQVHSGLKCSICLLDFELNQIVNQLPCDHIFHKNCIIPWLEYHNNCPMCRTTVEDNDFHPVSPSRDSRSQIRLELAVRNGEVVITENF